MTSDTEQALTNAIIKVIQGKQNKLYFVQGHGERSPDDSERSGYSSIAGLLASENFATAKLVLAQQRQVPADATVLVIAGPKDDFFPAEIDALKAYLAKGGKALFLVDPRERADSPALTNLVTLLKEWSIEVGDNVVINVPVDVQIKDGEAIDVKALASLPNSDGTFVLAAKYDPHPIVQGFRVAHRVSPRPVGLRRRRRRQRSHGPEHRRDHGNELGRDRHQAADDVGSGRARGIQGG